MTAEVGLAATEQGLIIRDSRGVLTSTSADIPCGFVSRSVRNLNSYKLLREIQPLMLNREIAQLLGCRQAGYTDYTDRTALPGHSATKVG